MFLFKTDNPNDYQFLTKTNGRRFYAEGTVDTLTITATPWAEGVFPQRIQCINRTCLTESLQWPELKLKSSISKCLRHKNTYYYASNKGLIKEHKGQISYANLLDEEDLPINDSNYSAQYCRVIHKIGLFQFGYLKNNELFTFC